MEKKILDKISTKKTQKGTKKILPQNDVSTTNIIIECFLFYESLY